MALPADQRLGLPAERLIWEGTTWPRACLSPLCCSSEHWRITNRGISYDHGCCKGDRDVLDIRRITDVSFHRRWWQLFCCRGTLVRTDAGVIVADDPSNPRTRITTFGMLDVYNEFKNVWLQSKQNTAVDV